MMYSGCISLERSSLLDPSSSSSRLVVLISLGDTGNRLHGPICCVQGQGRNFGNSQLRVGNFAFQIGREISATKFRVFREIGTFG